MHNINVDLRYQWRSHGLSEGDAEVWLGGLVIYGVAVHGQPANVRLCPYIGMYVHIRATVHAKIDLFQRDTIIKISFHMSPLILH